MSYEFAVAIVQALIMPSPGFRKSSPNSLKTRLFMVVCWLIVFVMLLIFIGFQISQFISVFVFGW